MSFCISFILLHSYQCHGSLYWILICSQSRLLLLLKAKTLTAVLEDMTSDLCKAVERLVSSAKSVARCLGKIW